MTKITVDILIVLISALIIILILVLIGDELKKLLQKITRLKIGDLELKLIRDILNPYEHIFFYNIKRYLKYEDNYPECDNKTKNLIIKNMLRIKLKYWYKHYCDFFSTTQTISASSMNNIIKNIILEYEQEWEKAEIPKYIIDAFKKKHGNKVEYMKTEMLHLFAYYPNDTDDIVFTHIFLNRSLILLDETFKDIKKVLKMIELKDVDKDYNYVYPQYIP